MQRMMVDDESIRDRHQNKMVHDRHTDNYDLQVGITKMVSQKNIF